MDSVPNRNVGRTDMAGELGFVPAPRETAPTPAMTRPSAGPASAMVSRSRAREGRVSVVPETEFQLEIEFRPGVEFRQEMVYRQKYRSLVREVLGHYHPFPTPPVCT